MLKRSTNPCDLVFLLILMTFLSGTTGATLTVSPSQITIGGTSPTSQLTVSCRPYVPGIKQVFNIEIGKKSSTGSNQPMIRITDTDSSVHVVDTSLQHRMTATGSISGATGIIQFILTDLRCADAASTYYCSTVYLAGSTGTDEATANITARTYPEQIEMFPSPDRVQYDDDGQVIVFRCTGRIGNQFHENNLQNLWTWEYRSIDNEFTPWTRYDQNITYDRPTPAAGCQYRGASTLLHAVSTQDNGRQFRCSVLSSDYSANKTVYVVDQQPPRSTTPSDALACSTYGQENPESSLGVGVAIGVCVMLAVDAICLGLAFVFRDKLANCISAVHKTHATVVAPVGIQTQGVGDEHEVPKSERLSKPPIPRLFESSGQ